MYKYYLAISYLFSISSLVYFIVLHILSPTGVFEHFQDIFSVKALTDASLRDFRAFSHFIMLFNHIK